MALMQLHWLNIDARISLKLILLVYKVLREQCSDNLKLQYKRFNGRPEDYLFLKHQILRQSMGRDCLSTMVLDCGTHCLSKFTLKKM